MSNKTSLLNKKLETIENEVYSLKSMLLKIVQEPKQKKIVKIKGLLKGISISEEDIEEAKKSLFKSGA